MMMNVGHTITIVVWVKPTIPIPYQNFDKVGADFSDFFL